MELHPPDQLSALPAVADVLLRYLDRLPLSAARRAALFADALAGSGTPARALARVHAALAAHAATAVNAAQATIGARLRLAIAETPPAGPSPVTRDVQGRQTEFRVLTMFGQVLYAMLRRSTKPRRPLAECVAPS